MCFCTLITFIYLEQIKFPSINFLRLINNFPSQQHSSQVKHDTVHINMDAMFYEDLWRVHDAKVDNGIDMKGENRMLLLQLSQLTTRASVFFMAIIQAKNCYSAENGYTVHL